jgi:osmotically-inducible protein OsmY
MEKGKVVLTGYVTSTGDLHKAIRAANETAGEKNVVNKLTIKEGGDGGTG